MHKSEDTIKAMASMIPEPHLGWVKAFLEAKLGLHYSDMRDSELSRKIREAADKSGHKTVEGYINWLRGVPLSRRDLELLASYITIGETYFLREGEAFDYLRYEYLSNFIYHNKKTKKKLTVWSAGCSSGEEVYSLAGLICELLPDRATWSVRILGTDINPAFLQKAREGVYSKWSFRKTPEWFMKFVEEVDDNHYRICDQLKEMVEFRSHNLSSDAAPVHGVNIIFCRNVLIYFSQELIRKVTAGFYDALTEGGLLVLSPVEVSSNICERFIKKFYAGRSFFIRNMHSSEPFIHAGIKYELPVKDYQEKAEGVSSDNEFERLRFLYKEGLYLRVDNLVSQRSGTLKDLPVEYQELLVKSKMRQNIYSEAEQLCMEIISTRQGNGTICYLLALMQLRKKHYKEAKKILEDILVRKPGYVLASYRLGIMAHQHGDVLDRDRYFSEVDRLLLDRDKAEVIDDYLDLQVIDLQRKMQEQREGV
jgi:chemotaxis protein methyltransferase CheR